MAPLPFGLFQRGAPYWLEDELLEEELEPLLPPPIRMPKRSPAAAPPASALFVLFRGSSA